MCTENTNSLIATKSSRGKDTHFTQKKKFLGFLSDKIATASMATAATGIPQKCLTRYKRQLEKSELLWEVMQDYCKVTGCMAWYLTTNPELVPGNHQLKLFSE